MSEEKQPEEYLEDWLKSAGLYEVFMAEDKGFDVVEKILEVYGMAVRARVGE